jgi:hypothetical protein
VEINEKMRGILIDWLVEVHLKFKVRNSCSWSSDMRLSISCKGDSIANPACSYCFRG